MALLIVDIATSALLVGENLEPLGKQFLRLAARLTPRKVAYEALGNLLALLRLNRMTLADAEAARGVLEKEGRKRDPLCPTFDQP